MKMILFMVVVFALLTSLGVSAKEHEKDIIQTSQGELEITFLGHGTLMFCFKNQVIHIDPYSRVADYSVLPKADLILITHDHGDHLDLKALEQIKTENTTVFLTEKCLEKCPTGKILKNGDVQTWNNIKIEAIPAYNIVHKRGNDQPYHPKGEGNGYILTIADKRIYIAGDTENTPEMKALKGIDIAFLPMNLPYTMTPEMVADAAKSFKPKILYPYHYGDTDTQQLVDLLKNFPNTEVRIRQMQ
jgi:L-ascorbate metabolism protein UlaG (beta-lactamase superfamily)